MNSIWIVIANASISNIYSITEKNRHFTLVKTLFHSESKLKNSDLVSDSPGHFRKGSNGLRGSYSEADDHKSLEIEGFSKQICTELENGRTSNAYTGLIIIAEPHFYGLIKKNCNHHIQDKIKHHLAKDYTHYSTKKLKAELETLLAHEIRLLLIS